MWKVDLPIKVPVSKNKIKKDRMFYLNLNQYRNANHFTLNTAKVSFDEIVGPRLIKLPLMSKIRISYWLYAGSQRELDVNNVCCIVDKFFCDSLVKAGLIPDDNYNFIIGTASVFGGIDKNNPRVEAYIEEITE